MHRVSRWNQLRFPRDLEFVKLAIDLYRKIFVIVAFTVVGDLLQRGSHKSGAGSIFEFIRLPACLR